MTMLPGDFIEKVSTFGTASASDKTKLIVYYWTEVRGAEVATRSEIESIFQQIDEFVPPSLASNLSGGLKSKPKRYVRRGNGYRLEINCKKRLEQQFLLLTKLRDQTPAPSKDAQLTRLEVLLTENPDKRFLEEAIICYSNKAYRAAIIMSWLLAMDHLSQSIVDKHREAFNDHLAADADKRLSGLTIATMDDLSVIKESKILELAEKSKIISKDVKRLWDERLGLRNSASHPSNIDIGQAKAAAFIEDVVENMIGKIA